jgi:hypothetical protein
MKTKTKLALATLSTITALSISSVYAQPAPDPRKEMETKPIVDPPPANAKNRIQIALLLDTSNSMDGLIDQAKTQLWKVVNTFINADRNGEPPIIEVAIYEYGNNNNALANNWVRLVSPFSRDLDEISANLFALKTNGGEEYCGAVIQRAMGDLQWDDNKTTYKTIFIAGNEPFTQGEIDALTSSKEALAKGIIINTIHCGPRQEGIDGAWHSGAAQGGGDFLVIDQDKTVSHIPAPQDKRISDLSLELNKTYLGYGKMRDAAIENQNRADSDAEAHADRGANLERAITKASGNYSNAGWDLVDAWKEKKIDPATIPAAELPEELAKLTPEQRTKTVKDAAETRARIQTEINELNAEREKHIAAQLKETADTADKTLDQAIIETTRRQATNLGYEFKN